MEIIRRDPYDPWQLVNRLHRDWGTLFPPRVFGTPAVEASDIADWVPAVDISEEDDRFVIRADVPGVNPSDLEITMEDGVLSIQGSRESTSEDEDNGLRRAERIRGRFRRSFSLPETANEEGIAADYNNGVLEIAIPKRQKAEPKRITVKAS